MQRDAEGQGLKPISSARRVEMRHSAARRRDRLERGVAGAARRPAENRKDRQHAIAHEFEHFAAEGVHGAGDAVEPGVERRNDLGRRRAFRQAGEAAQVGEQERRLDRLADAAPERAGKHARGAAPAEIGLERHRQRGAGAERRKRGHGEACGLAEAAGLLWRERTRTHPAEPRPVGGRPDRVLMHRAGAKAGKPAPAGFAGLAGRSGRHRPSHKSQRLDHLAASRPPQQGAPGDERVRRGQGERAAGERLAVLDQAPPEPRQKKLGRRRLGGLVNQPGEGRIELHGSIIGRTRPGCHQRFAVPSGTNYSTKWLNLVGRSLIFDSVDPLDVDLTKGRPS